jgi:hypothetical protein
MDSDELLNHVRETQRWVTEALDDDWKLPILEKLQEVQMHLHKLRYTVTRGADYGD